MSQAPLFCLKDQDSLEHCLEDYRGKWVLVYFYPKDDTTGCTKEACGIRDVWPKFSNRDVVVLGISADSVESHKKFREKYRLPFTLLSDPNREVIRKYGVWKEKSMYGRKYMGISRESFLVDPNGNIAKHYEKVKPATHAEEVIENLNILRKNSK